MRQRGQSWVCVYCMEGVLWHDPHDARTDAHTCRSGAVAYRGSHSAGCPGPALRLGIGDLLPILFHCLGSKTFLRQVLPSRRVAGRAPVLPFSWAPGARTRKDAHNPTFPRLALRWPEVPDIPSQWCFSPQALGCTQGGDPYAPFFDEETEEHHHTATTRP